MNINDFNETLANELIEDLNNLRQSILSFEDRWRTYGSDFYTKLSPKKRKELYKAFDDFRNTMRTKK
jgi:hypothetical protein